MEEKQIGCRFFFAAAVDGIAALLEECRFRFKRVFGSEQRIKQTSFGTSVYITLQKTADGFEDFKSILRKDGININDLTIYEFFRNLNEALKPKKQDKNGGQ